MANKVILSPEYFPLFDKGRPVSNAYIYVGEPDTDPEVEANQKQLYILQEDSTTLQINQPLRTSGGGVPIYNGSPVTPYVDGLYSLKVLDRHQNQIYYVPRNSFDLPELSSYRLSDFGGDWDSAILSIGSNDALLVVDTPTTMSGSVTVPKNIALEWYPGCVVDGSYIFTIQGSLSAGHYQLFDDELFVKCEESILSVNAIWHGFDVDATSTVNGNALQNAINSASYGPNIVNINSGFYEVNRTIYTYRDGPNVVNNPNFNTNTNRASSSMTIVGTGAIKNSKFSFYDFSDPNTNSYLTGTIIKSTLTSGNCFQLGNVALSTYTDKRNGGNVRIKDITLLGETSGRVIDAAYGPGMVLERLFIGMKENVACTGLAINNCWGATYRNITITSKTSSLDVSTGPQSRGVYLDIYEETSGRLSGGNFYFEKVTTANCYTGFYLKAGINVNLIDCGDVFCRTAVRIDEGDGFLFDNYYNEQSWLTGLSIRQARNVVIKGGYMDLKYATNAGILIGDSAGATSVYNVSIDGMYIRFIGCDLTEAEADARGLGFIADGGDCPAIKRYLNTHNITVKNINAKMWGDPFAETSINVPNLMELSNIRYSDESGDASPYWTYNPTKLVLLHGSTTSDLRRTCDMDVDGFQRIDSDLNLSSSILPSRLSIKANLNPVTITLPDEPKSGDSCKIYIREYNSANTIKFVLSSSAVSDGYMLSSLDGFRIDEASDSNDSIIVRNGVGLIELFYVQDWEGDTKMWVVQSGPELRRGRGSGVWSEGTDGGAVGEYVLGYIPNNATITRAWYEVKTAVDGGAGSATLQAGVDVDDNDGIIPITGWSSGLFTTTGYRDGVPQGLVAGFTDKSTNRRAVIFKINVDPVDAGKIFFWWEWIVSE